MKLTAGRIGTIVAVAVLIAAAIVLAVRGVGDSTKPAQAGKVSSPSATATATPTPSASAQPATTPPPPADARMKQLQGQIVQLISTYYLVQPGDTAETRKARSAPLMPADILEQQNFDTSGTESSKESAATTAKRLAQKLTVRAQIDTAHNFMQVNDTLGDMYSAVPVNIRLYAPNGSFAGVDRTSVTVYTIWKWDNDQNKWSPINFSEGGD